MYNVGNFTDGTVLLGNEKNDYVENINDDIINYGDDYKIFFKPNNRCNNRNFMQSEKYKNKEKKSNRSFVKITLLVIFFIFLLLLILLGIIIYKNIIVENHNIHTTKKYHDDTLNYYQNGINVVKNNDHNEIYDLTKEKDIFFSSITNEILTRYCETMGSKFLEFKLEKITKYKTNYNTIDNTTLIIPDLNYEIQSYLKKRLELKLSVEDKIHHKNKYNLFFEDNAYLYNTIADMIKRKIGKSISSICCCMNFEMNNKVCEVYDNHDKLYSAGKTGLTCAFREKKFIEIYLKKNYIQKNKTMCNVSFIFVTEN